MFHWLSKGHLADWSSWREDLDELVLRGNLVRFRFCRVCHSKQFRIV